MLYCTWSMVGLVVGGGQGRGLAGAGTAGRWPAGRTGSSDQTTSTTVSGDSKILFFHQPTPAKALIIFYLGLILRSKIDL